MVYSFTGKRRQAYKWGWGEDKAMKNKRRGEEISLLTRDQRYTLENTTEYIG